MRRAYERCNMLGKLEKRAALKCNKKVIEVTLPSSFKLTNILPFKDKHTQKKNLFLSYRA